jgi:DNA-binding NarL/FixJ family response regulator
MASRILLADDHALVRHGLRLTLESEHDFEVTAEAADGAEAVRLGLAQPVDLAVLDVAMPRLTGIQAARQLTEHRPEMKVLILSMHDNEQFFFEALRAGASGYVLKSAAHEDLVAACRAALRGEPFLYPRGVAALVREFLDRGPGAELQDPLSPRETEVVKLIAEGLTSREIGELLHISDKTVERHRSNVLEKLGLRDRVALTRYAIRRGLVEP